MGSLTIKAKTVTRYQTQGTKPIPAIPSVTPSVNLPLSQYKLINDKSKGKEANKV